MKVLIGAESSGRVRNAFAALGHDASSCDLLPDEGGSPKHIVGDIRSVLRSRVCDGLDLLIVHLPCTYMCNSSVWAFTKTPPNPSPGVLYGSARFAALRDAVELWLEVAAAPVARIAMENPVAHHYATDLIGKPTQSIQPYQFGDDASKRTCLWLKGLPALRALPRSQWVTPRLVDGRPRWANQTDAGQNRLTPSKDRWRDRARTYSGIAQAMAEQWGILQPDSQPSFDALGLGGVR